jgi:hypothetical protein
LQSTQSSSTTCREDKLLDIDENARTSQKHKKIPKATAAYTVTTKIVSMF